MNKRDEDKEIVLCFAYMAALIDGDKELAKKLEKEIKELKGFER